MLGRGPAGVGRLAVGLGAGLAAAADSRAASRASIRSSLWPVVWGDDSSTCRRALSCCVSRATRFTVCSTRAMFSSERCRASSLAARLASSLVPKVTKLSLKAPLSQAHWRVVKGFADSAVTARGASGSASAVVGSSPLFGPGL